MVFPKTEFNKASVKDANINKGLLVDLFNQIDEDKLNIHSMLLLKDGSRVFRASAHEYDEDTREEVYSVSKSFTSVAIGILYDLKLLALDDYVLFYFQDDVKEYLPEYESLKIRHLLTMSAGQEKDIFKELTPNDNIFEKFFNQPLIHKPGETFMYSNFCT
ncbi:MAG: beta-lactamase family protein, partial [Bacilli bacterium]|nr:beta-lactamase family protein [Bacilli bacterium]